MRALHVSSLCPQCEHQQIAKGGPCQCSEKLIITRALTEAYTSVNGRAELVNNLLQQDMAQAEAFANLMPGAFSCLASSCSSVQSPGDDNSDRKGCCVNMYLYGCMRPCYTRGKHFATHDTSASQAPRRAFCLPHGMLGSTSPGCTSWQSWACHP